jgi:hypothetical protein
VNSAVFKFKPIRFRQVLMILKKRLIFVTLVEDVVPGMAWDPSTQSDFNWFSIMHLQMDIKRNLVDSDFAPYYYYSAINSIYWQRILFWTVAPLTNQCFPLPSTPEGRGAFNAEGRGSGSAPCLPFANPAANSPHHGTRWCVVPLIRKQLCRVILLHDPKKRMERILQVYTAYSSE